MKKYFVNMLWGVFLLVVLFLIAKEYTYFKESMGNTEHVGAHCHETAV